MNLCFTSGIFLAFWKILKICLKVPQNDQTSDDNCKWSEAILKKDFSSLELKDGLPVKLHLASVNWSYIFYWLNEEQYWFNNKKSLSKFKIALLYKYIFVTRCCPRGKLYSEIYARKFAEAPNFC